MDNLLEYSLERGIIPDQQHGFIPGRSVTSNLLPCLDDWTRALDEGRPTDVVYLDFSKAFDKVSHRRLFHKLHYLGVGGRLLDWIAAYLRNPTFQVRLGETLSDPELVTSGVPQGSVLGPLLFVLYTYDLHQYTKCAHQSFADDNKVYADPNTHSHQLQLDLNSIHTWTENWLLPLNPLKCTVLHIGGARNPQHVYHGVGTPLLKHWHRSTWALLSLQH